MALQTRVCAGRRKTRRYLQLHQRLVPLRLHPLLHGAEVHGPLDDQSVARSDEIIHWEGEKRTWVFPRREETQTHIDKVMVENVMDAVPQTRL